MGQLMRFWFSSHKCKLIEPGHVIFNNVVFLASLDSDEPVQPHVKL